jgi:hypothetical protein
MSERTLTTENRNERSTLGLLTGSQLAARQGVDLFFVVNWLDAKARYLVRLYIEG